MSRKPALTCERSQNGLLREWPQRQNAILGPHAVRVRPPLLTSVSDPSTMQGPFVAGVMRSRPPSVSPAVAVMPDSSEARNAMPS
jgi:hypothetical protein